MSGRRDDPVKAGRLPSNQGALPAPAPDAGVGDALPAEIRPPDFLVVGIGASAGGLDACRKLVSALPVGMGVAFILVQHLDPSHDSMMVELLAGHTVVAMRQAADGMPIEPDHLYVIPPGAYLSVGKGALQLSSPRPRHGARLPFDFLLYSLAENYGNRAVAVVLSGTGTDGSLGLRSIKEHQGLVIAQDPAEAGYDGMPRSAIMTGLVDHVLPAARIPEAITRYQAQGVAAPTPDLAPALEATPDWLSDVITLLRTRTPHDFTLYKTGTLLRRIERRMAIAGVEIHDRARYFDILRRDTMERDHLATDLLINVTRFFRDPNVFDVLAESVIPALIRDQTADQPLRLWVAGCSTGEEAYSLAMLFYEQITAAKRSIKLQVFGSDIDADAVAAAREGLYPESIAEDVSPARLVRFFVKEGHDYRVSPELRSTLVFTVQNLLSDPPFSRLDLISCRNLLIYLRPEAQAKAIALFHFALRQGGILLLGSAETVGSGADHFALIAKSERIYRHIVSARPGDTGSSRNPGDSALRIPLRLGYGPAPSREAAYADLCRRLVMEAYAPATVLINGKQECLYSLGPTDRYLRVAPGHPTHDLLAIAAPRLRTRLRAAIMRAAQERIPVAVIVARSGDGDDAACRITVQPVTGDGEALLLISFVDEPLPQSESGSEMPIAPHDLPRIAELERELDTTRMELREAIHNLEVSSEEQKAINEEAMSVNEECQSTNEELLTSKEELQSLNEELTSLNTQLHETLDRQRTTANDLQNVLYSTDVATIFLDVNLRIRFFTPATTLLFSVISSDVGRPLADLTSLAVDSVLLADARTVLQTLAPIEREIEARSGAWYNRRIMPYRTQDGGVEGVVMTFADITERRHVADALEAAKRQAQSATMAKSRFLAAASHDLRQPLQTLALLQGLLARSVEGEKPRKLVERLDETLNAMSAMLNKLLDINQIEAGTVHPEIVSFPINDLLHRMRDEFAYHARDQHLALHVVSCGLSIQSDPRLLEQMIRNLLSNALKYTKSGKVLLGCRRRGDTLRVEVWDSGVGIPAGELNAIFEEYHQLDNAARQQSLGLGLGLSIVQRLGNLLGHPVRVRSKLGAGSVFMIEIKRPSADGAPPPERALPDKVAAVGHRAGGILIVEDDPEVRDLLDLLLKDEGHRTVTAADGVAALDLVTRGGIRPDLMLADYNLPNEMDGLQLTVKLRETLHRPIPVIILTGDITTRTLRTIAREDCVQLNKPVKLAELTQVVRDLLGPSAGMPAVAPAPAMAPAPAAPRHIESATGLRAPVIIVVDDDAQVRGALRSVLEDDGRLVEDFASCEDFLGFYRPGQEACLLIDAVLPGMSGLELLQHLQATGHPLPSIMITGNGDVTMAVQAMKAGAFDFIEKPVGVDELLTTIARALEHAQDGSKLSSWHETAATYVASLTPRQRQIMEMVLAGQPSKNIAADLGISQRTVENHRASIMKRTHSKSLPALARLALAADTIRAA
ncbi:MAG: chemotaxis protein CheB [Azospirillaceae bacterium]|nr:chemotaxis protein CheB [Azospirillaceae bacterium]